MAQTPMRRSGTAGTLRATSNQLGIQTGTVTTGGISGRRGTDVVTLTRGDNTILSALYVGDGVDDGNSNVCYIQAHFWSKPSPSSPVRELKRRFDMCRPQVGRDPQVGDVRFHQIGFEPGSGVQHYTATDDLFRAATGIQTCSTSGVPYVSDRSIVFFEADVDAEGSFASRQDVTDIYLNGQTSTCRDNRQAARMCPSGQVVVGVDVHYRRSGLRTRVLGLAPKCAPVTVTSGSSLRPRN
ncbi:MAG: hypothetical protein Rubg2KO_27940 [Rubricoccaceae bacterium]